MIPWVVIVLCTMAAVEIGIRLPFSVRLAILREAAARVAPTIGSASVSDREKQRILSACARRIFASSVAMFFLLLAVLAPFLLAVPLSELTGYGILEPAASASGIAATIVTAAVYGFLRARVAR